MTVMLPVRTPVYRPVWRPGARGDDSLFSYEAGTVLPTGTTYSRTSTATQYSDDLITHATGVPPLANGFDHWGAANGILPYSNTPYTNWTAVSATVTQDATGYLNEFDDAAVVASTGSDWNRAQAILTTSVASGTVYGGSIWYKAGTSGNALINLRLETATTESRIAGTAGSLTVTLSDAGAVVLLREQSLGDGIYRVDYRWTPNANETSARIGVGPYTTTAGQNVTVLGGSFNAGNGPWPYIRSTASAGSRAAADARYDFGAVALTQPFVIGVRLTRPWAVPSGSFPVVFRAGPNTSSANDRLDVYVSGSNQKFSAAVFAGGVSQVGTVTPDVVLVPYTEHIVVVAVDPVTTTLRLSVDGSTPAEGTGGTWPAFRYGGILQQHHSAAGHYNGNTDRFRVWNADPSDAQLQEMAIAPGFF